MVKLHEGATYLFAVGMRPGTARVSFELRDLADEATARVLGEGRQLAVNGGRFEDHFRPYEVHLYRIK